jgi:hypothetical protein
MLTHVLRASAARAAVAGLVLAAASAGVGADVAGAAPAAPIAPAAPATPTAPAAPAVPAAPAQGAPLRLHPTVVEEDPSLPDHTIYRPTDLAAVGHELPIIAWGNGICLGNGIMYKDWLQPLSSFGALVISNGVPDGQGGSTADQLIDAIDWAIQEDSRPGSIYYGRLATDQIALMGQSCGGIQALQVSDDPRVATTVAWNSGLFVGGDKSALTRLHAPTAWITGGTTDIAYGNSIDDYALVPDSVPSVLGHYEGAGHLDLFYNPVMRPQSLRAAVHWLNAVFTGSEASLAEFTECRLCADDPNWTIEAKNWP